MESQVPGLAGGAPQEEAAVGAAGGVQGIGSDWGNSRWGIQLPLLVKVHAEAKYLRHENKY